MVFSPGHGTPRRSLGTPGSVITLRRCVARGQRQPGNAPPGRRLPIALRVIRTSPVGVLVVAEPAASLATGQDFFQKIVFHRIVVVFPQKAVPGTIMAEGLEEGAQIPQTTKIAGRCHIHSGAWGSVNPGPAVSRRQTSCGRTGYS